MEKRLNGVAEGFDEADVGVERQDERVRSLLESDRKQDFEGTVGTKQLGFDLGIS